VFTQLTAGYCIEYYVVNVSDQADTDQICIKCKHWSAGQGIEYCMGGASVAMVMADMYKQN
jgi:hypothetical protein